MEGQSENPPSIVERANVLTSKNRDRATRDPLIKQVKADHSKQEEAKQASTRKGNRSRVGNTVKNVARAIASTFPTKGV